MVLPPFTLRPSKVSLVNDLRHFSCRSWEHRSVTKKEIVKTISDETGLTQLQIKEIVQRTFQAIIENLVDEGRVELRNFGVFQVKPRAARKARNPRTGHQVEVPEKFVVTFKPGKEMENRVKQMATSENAEAWKEMLRSQLSGDSTDADLDDSVSG
jgi:integration host factor subunit beta